MYRADAKFCDIYLFVYRNSTKPKKEESAVWMEESFEFEHRIRCAISIIRNSILPLVPFHLNSIAFYFGRPSRSAYQLYAIHLRFSFIYWSLIDLCFSFQFWHLWQLIFFRYLITEIENRQCVCATGVHHVSVQQIRNKMSLYVEKRPSRSVASCELLDASRDMGIRYVTVFTSRASIEFFHWP